MFPFFIGVLLALLFTALINYRINRKVSIKEEAVQRLEQEKQIVIDFMHSISGAITGEKNRQKLFHKIIHAAITNTGAMSACIFEKKADERFYRIAVEGLFPPQNQASISILKHTSSRTDFIKNAYETESYASGEGLVGSVAQTGKPILISRAKNDPRVIQHDDPALHIHSLMLAPVTYDESLIAILAVANPISGVPFDTMDFSLLQSLASHVGLAIQNSTTIQLQIEKNKIDLDLQLAQNIQNLLLPSRFPKNIPLEFAAHYVPAQKIGGDLYDVFEIDADSIGVAIADVSGKGIPASIVMAMCQTHLKHLTKQKTSPADILKLLNEELLKTMRPGMFVTLSLGIINLRTNTLTIARAGHEAPLFFSPNHKDKLFPIEVSGMALGIVPPDIFNQKIEDFTLSFLKGDVLVLYTDGVTEMENKKQVEFSTDRLMRIIYKTSSKNAKSIVSEIIKSLNNFSEGLEPIDDQTLLLIKYTGEAK